MYNKMWKIITWIFNICLLTFITSGCKKQNAANNKLISHTNYVFNKAPLAPNHYAELPIGAIVPQGWLHVQLEKMAHGLAGKLGQLYPDVGPNNAWIGGNGDSWERGPYYLDGLIPLAYILKDKDLINKAKKWIDWSLNSQQPNGYFGPRPNPGVKDTVPHIQVANKADWWPRMVMLKAFESYYSATSDQRVIPFMRKYFKYQLNTLPSKPLNHWTWWAKARGGENQEAVYWLYNRTGDRFLLKLAPMLYKQTLDWTDGFLTGNLPSTHGVNVAMALKQPALNYMQTKDPKYLRAVDKGWNDLMSNDGVVQGVFTSDELLHGKNPTHGTELCTVVETMYSLENLVRITGRVKYADAIERIAYNALPAQITAAYSGRQYFQEANQPTISEGDRNFTTAYKNAVCYGILTGYPCCTVNMHQGWPKFVRNLWMATPDNGLAAILYAPNKVTAKVADGKKVTLDEKTDYPFKGKIVITFNSDDLVAFPLHLRIPGWVKNAKITINGKTYANPSGDQMTEINRTWKNGDKVVLNLSLKVRTDRWFENSLGIERGPLVFALKIPGKWDKIGEVDSVPIWGVKPQKPWNYGLIINKKDIPSSFKVKVADTMPDYPWTIKKAPIELIAEGKRISNWKLYDNYAGPLPHSPVRSYQKKEIITLIPYGSTTLRIAEFPIILNR
jgi:DUF1680 family protein